MSFLKSLFGGGKKDASPKALRREEYKGFVIEAAPYMAEGQYQVAGSVSKEFDGAVKVHKFVRADRMASQDDAAGIAIKKGQQLVDQLGDRMFGID
jgi:hypothetical protein